MICELEAFCACGRGDDDLRGSAVGVGKRAGGITFVRTKYLTETSSEVMDSPIAQREWDFGAGHWRVRVFDQMPRASRAKLPEDSTPAMGLTMTFAEAGGCGRRGADSEGKMELGVTVGREDEEDAGSEASSR